MVNILKDKKIGFFIGSLTIGGVEKVSLTYINTLAEMDYDITCIVCNSSVLDSLLSPKVKLVNLQVRRLRNCVLPLSKILSKFSFDVIVCTNIQTLFVYVAREIAKVHVAIITSHHFYCNNVETPFYYKMLLRYVYNKCNLIIAVSEGIKKEMEDVIKVNKVPICILNNPIDIDEILGCSNKDVNIQGDINDLKIVWVGRMNTVKNLFLLIDSIIELRSKYNKVTLHLIGDGQDYNLLKEYVKNKSANDYVYFYGAKTNPYPYIAMADIVALSSSSEAYPTVLLESMCLGKICVSTPTKGAEDILARGKYGYISKTFNLSDFVEALSRGLHSNIDKVALINYAKRFDKKEKVGEFLSIISRECREM